MPPELLGASEIGALLGLTRQRVDQLARTDDTFPVPEGTVGRNVRVWSREAVEEWAMTTGRQLAVLGVGETELPAPTGGTNPPSVVAAWHIAMGRSSRTACGLDLTGQLQWKPWTETAARTRCSKCEEWAKATGREIKGSP